MLLLGFIDAHMHTAMALLRGLAQDTRNWMMYGLGPFSAQLSEAAMAAGTRLAVIEALKAGTTTFGDYGWSMDDACAFLQRVGARGAITVTIREVVPRMYDPGELYEFDSALGDQRLAENLRVFDRWHTAANGRLRVFFGPQGPDFLGQKLLQEVQRAARERQTKIHMHTAQGDRETAQMHLRYGQRSIAWLDALGYLDERLLAVQLTEASEEEAQLVARRGARLVRRSPPNRSSRSHESWSKALGPEFSGDTQEPARLRALPRGGRRVHCAGDSWPRRTATTTACASSRPNTSVLVRPGAAPRQDGPGAADSRARART